jgi:hypothetical protein
VYQHLHRPFVVLAWPSASLSSTTATIAAAAAAAAATACERVKYLIQLLLRSRAYSPREEPIINFTTTITIATTTAAAITSQAAITPDRPHYFAFCLIAGALVFEQGVVVVGNVLQLFNIASTPA